jgi:hypothetical protein
MGSLLRRYAQLLIVRTSSPYLIFDKWELDEERRMTRDGQVAIYSSISYDRGMQQQRPTKGAYIAGAVICLGILSILGGILASPDKKTAAVSAPAPSVVREQVIEEEQGKAVEAIDPPVEERPTAQPTLATSVQGASQAPVQYAPKAATNGTGVSAGYDGSDKDCSDFASHAEAQAYFESRGGSPTNNVDRLDRDGDGLACEAN